VVVDVDAEKKMGVREEGRPNAVEDYLIDPAGGACGSVGRIVKWSKEKENHRGLEQGDRDAKRPGAQAQDFGLNHERERPEVKPHPE
jgi:hypothetical protein